eukprot:TRINITY_DN38472_c0_g1_i1.p1 TRINITY_DN38472_c0_g1~~TRINITY_DN38472_c0_g1_i1.p1  ORF type:complete len:225 (-),score=34.55 TRINITY_DN38472_c0_g1_i1:467-1141(-)
MAGLKSVYLSSYNIVLTLGWAFILFRAIEALLSPAGMAGVYPAVAFPLQIWQTAALFEVFNSATGIVRSPIAATLPQIASRLLLTWGILFSFPETHSSPLVTSLILSWSTVEIVRYGFFACKETFGVTPKALLWLRYSLFYILYPAGIASELGLIWLALPFMPARKLYTIEMPNAFNFAFDYHWACWMALIAYVPVSPHMYLHMMGQRRKALRKPADLKGKKEA